MLTSGKVIVELTCQEALVLFDLLYRLDENNVLTFEDQAEERVLWTVESLLEKQLSEVISPGYREYLQEAREAVRDPVD